MNPTEFLRRKSPLILDSAMGTELQRLGVPPDATLWSAAALASAPHIVRNIHYHNLLAGADILTTNTFRTNPRTFARAGISDAWEDYTLRAVGLAHEARERYRARRPVLVAASIAPLEDCYAPALTPPDAELDAEHGAFAEFLSRAGVDFLLVETMPTVREAVAASRACARTGMPFAVSFVCGDDGRLLSGEDLAAAADAVLPLHPAAVLVNCLPASRAGAALRVLRATGAPAIGCYANTGDPTRVPAEEIVRDITAAAYARCAVEWRAAGAAIIGGCCGTTPEYIRALHDILYPDTGYPDSY